MKHILYSDIDEFLFVDNNKLTVINLKTGETFKAPKTDYYTYERDQNFHLDMRDYVDASIFMQAEAIKSNIGWVIAAQMTGVEVVYVTARQSPNSLEMFKSKMEANGLFKPNIIFSGDLQIKLPHLSMGECKAINIAKDLEKRNLEHKTYRFHVADDNINNLNDVISYFKTCNSGMKLLNRSCNEAGKWLFHYKPETNELYNLQA